MDDIKILASQIHQLNRRAYAAYKPLVESIISECITDNQQIERLLDGMISFCGDNNMLELYKQVCRYYYSFNPVATVTYIEFYKEMWDS